MDSLKLKKEQLKLASKVELRDRILSIKTIGGGECLAKGDALHATIVVCAYPSMKLLETATYEVAQALPYRPGFRAYRELPALIEAFNKLEQEPDVLLVKGHGIAHPRRVGIASHLGIVLNVPTIGVAESLLCGTPEKGRIIFSNEIVGFEVLTKEHAKQIYVSPGHLITLGSALRIIKECIRLPHKLPEPLHLAHKIGRKRMKQGGREKMAVTAETGIAHPIPGSFQDEMQPL